VRQIGIAVHRRTRGHAIAGEAGEVPPLLRDLGDQTICGPAAGAAGAGPGAASPDANTAMTIAGMAMRIGCTPGAEERLRRVEVRLKPVTGPAEAGLYEARLNRQR
jgi:hypothetical protein